MGAMDFIKAEFWVQIHNVPLFCLIRETSIFLGSKIGKVVEFDEEEENNKCGNFIRVRVEIDVHKPLKRLLKVDLIGGGDKRMLVLKYTRLPDLCYCCGLLGHGDRECPRNAESHISGVKQYGPWLRASSPPKWLGNRGRRDGGHKEKNPTFSKDGGERTAGRLLINGKTSPPEDSSRRSGRKPLAGEPVEALGRQRKKATKAATTVDMIIAQHPGAIHEIPGNGCEKGEVLETKGRLVSTGKSEKRVLDRELKESEGCGGPVSEDSSLVDQVSVPSQSSGPKDGKPIKENKVKDGPTSVRNSGDRSGELDPIVSGAQSKRKWKRQARGSPMVIDREVTNKVNLKRGSKDMDGEDQVSFKKMKGASLKIEDPCAGSLDLHEVVKSNELSASLETVQACQSK